MNSRSMTSWEITNIIITSLNYEKLSITFRLDFTYFLPKPEKTSQIIQKIPSILASSFFFANKHDNYFILTKKIKKKNQTNITIFLICNCKKNFFIFNFTNHEFQYSTTPYKSAAFFTFRLPRNPYSSIFTLFFINNSPCAFQFSSIIQWTKNKHRIEISIRLENK